MYLRVLRWECGKNSGLLKGRSKGGEKNAGHIKTPDLSGMFKRSEGRYGRKT